MFRCETQEGYSSRERRVFEQRGKKKYIQLLRKGQGRAKNAGAKKTKNGGPLGERNPGTFRKKDFKGCPKKGGWQPCRSPKRKQERGPWPGKKTPNHRREINRANNKSTLRKLRKGVRTNQETSKYVSGKKRAMGGLK